MATPVSMYVSTGTHTSQHVHIYIKVPGGVARTRTLDDVVVSDSKGEDVAIPIVEVLGAQQSLAFFLA